MFHYIKNLICIINFNYISIIKKKYKIILLLWNSKVHIIIRNKQIIYRSFIFLKLSSSYIIYNYPEMIISQD